MATDSIFASKGPAKPFSSRSDRLFGALYGRGEVALQASDDAWLQAMLDVEAALAQACALEGGAHVLLSTLTDMTPLKAPVPLRVSSTRHGVVA